jgi:hypothetical protein
MRRREGLELTVDHPVVTRKRGLCRDVVFLEAKMGGQRGEDVDGLARRQPLKLGDIVLDDETAAGLKVCGGITESLGLCVLAGQVRDRSDWNPEPFTSGSRSHISVWEKSGRG